MTFARIPHPAGGRLFLYGFHPSLFSLFFSCVNFERFCLRTTVLTNGIKTVQVGSLQACYMAKRGHQVELYELRDGSYNYLRFPSLPFMIMTNHYDDD